MELKFETKNAGSKEQIIIDDVKQFITKKTGWQIISKNGEIRFLSNSIYNLITHPEELIS